jgi:hypothetical protein
VNGRSWRIAGITAAGFGASAACVACTAPIQAYGARQLLGRWWVEVTRLAPWDREPRAFVHGGALVVLAVLGLVALWLLGAWVVLHDRVPPRVVLAVAALWATPFALAPPMLSQDAYAFLAQGAVTSHGNPYRPPAAVLGAGSPLLQAVDPLYRARVSPYGPLALRLFSACLAVSHGNAVVALICLRLVILLAIAVTAWCAWRLAPAGRRSLTLWMLLANPLVLLHLVGGLHLEAVLMAGLGVAWVLHTVGRTRWAVVVVLVAAAVKVTVLIALPVLLISALRRGGWRALAQHMIAGAAAALALACVLQPDPTGWWPAIPATLRVWNPVSLPTQAALVWSTLTHTSVLASLPVLRGAALALGVMAAAYLCLTASRRPPVTTAGYVLLASTLAGPALWPWYLVPAVACLLMTGGTTELVVAAAAGIAAVMSDLPMPVVQMQRVTALGDAGGLLLVTAALLVLRRRAGTTGRRSVDNLTVP